MRHGKRIALSAAQMIAATAHAGDMAGIEIGESDDTPPPDYDAFGPPHRRLKTPCPDCGRPFATRDGLERHKLEKHTPK